jgi:hypothetical protein
MNYRIFCLFFVLNLSFTGYAAPIISGNYWQCTTFDSTNKHWSAISVYKKIAKNFSFSSCKKESTLPASCKTSTRNCDQFINGVNVQPMWECTALDAMAEPWKSNDYPSRVDAALGAKAYCQQKSTVPGTCYINLVTCVNKNL